MIPFVSFTTTHVIVYWVIFWTNSIRQRIITSYKSNFSLKYFKLSLPSPHGISHLNIKKNCLDLLYTLVPYTYRPPSYTVDLSRLLLFRTLGLLSFLQSYRTGSLSFNYTNFFLLHHLPRTPVRCAL